MCACVCVCTYCIFVKCYIYVNKGSWPVSYLSIGSAPTVSCLSNRAPLVKKKIKNDRKVYLEKIFSFVRGGSTTQEVCESQ